jgi:hypothetical protein
MKNTIIFILFQLFSIQAFCYDDWDRRFIKATCSINSERYANFAYAWAEESKNIFETTTPKSDLRELKLKKLFNDAEDIENKAFEWDKKYSQNMFDRSFYKDKTDFAINFHEENLKWMRKLSVIWGLENYGKSLDFFKRYIYETCMDKFHK